MLLERHKFIPMTVDEMNAQHIRELDVLLITGDAYFDHPSHGAAVIGRVLIKAGYRVGLISGPDWRSVEDFMRLGRPTLFAGVTSGAVDSIVNNYTASTAKRKTDVYAPGGIGGNRPDTAALVYASRVKEAFPKLPVVLGGVEASLRRFAYFDTLSKKIRRSILVDSRADILVYGSGERQVLQIAEKLGRNEDLRGIPGTAYLTRDDFDISEEKDIVLPDFDELLQAPYQLVKQTLAIEIASRPGCSVKIRQRYAEGWVICEPRPVISSTELDSYFDLPFVREVHPAYKQTVPAFETVRWSTISHRGCPGGCSFCGLAAHQGREVVSRSSDSIIEEIRRLSKDPKFRGTVTDVGGPTANAYGMQRRNISACNACRRTSCLYPKICPHLDIDPSPLLQLLEQSLCENGIRHVFIASGIRHDLALKQKDLIAILAARHIGGHIKAAPEHVSARVLEIMRKPKFELFEEFEYLFRTASRKANKKQYVLPYFIAGFPGCTKADADLLTKKLESRNQTLEQCQSFIPIAGTSAAAFAYSGKNEHGQDLYIPDTKESNRQKKSLLKPVSKQISRR